MAEIRSINLDEYPEAKSRLLEAIALVAKKHPNFFSANMGAPELKAQKKFKIEGKVETDGSGRVTSSVDVSFEIDW